MHIYFTSFDAWFSIWVDINPRNEFCDAEHGCWRCNKHVIVVRLRYKTRRCIVYLKSDTNNISINMMLFLPCYVSLAISNCDVTIMLAYAN